METRTARLKRTIFNNDDFFIVEMEQRGFHTFKAKGVFPQGAHYGQEYEITGDFKTSKYGDTFEIKQVKPVKPKKEAGIIDFLVANVPSVGLATASKIVKAWGNKTLDFLDNEPDKLHSLGFLKPVQIEAIQREWAKAEETRTISIFLMDLGLGAEMVKHVYGTLGEDTIARITKNPYCLIKVNRIGFKRADEIALRIGLSPDSEARVAACLIHCLRDLAPQQGHLFLHEKELKVTLTKLLSKLPSCFPKALANMIEEKEIFLDDTRYYSAHNYKTEHESAEKIAGYIQAPCDLDHDLNAFLKDYEQSHTITLSEEQRQAILSLQDNQLLVVTGLPGTGKTTVIKAFVSFYSNLGIPPLLLAPTGMAAKRLNEVTNWPASTIHRALGYDGQAWAHCAEAKLKSKVVIVDETSMVDQEVFYRLLEALESDTRLIFVGDPAQLPSVGAGNVLRELGECKEVNQVHLETIHRQAQESRIVVNAHRINRGEKIKPFNEKGSDFMFLESQDGDKILGWVRQLVRRLRSKGEGFQVLSPMHKGKLGVQNLNKLLRAELNPKKNQRTIRIGDKDFREDDRVIVTRNLYDKGVMNGDIGTVCGVETKTLQIQVPGMDAPVEFTGEEAREHLTLAYCITIHKSQGQEYDNVIFPMTESFSIMLQRNLIYTAVTRGKKAVYIFGTSRAVGRAIHNNKETSRNTMLATRITDILNE